MLGPFAFGMELLFASWGLVFLVGICFAGGGLPFRSACLGVSLAGHRGSGAVRLLLVGGGASFTVLHLLGLLFLVDLMQGALVRMGVGVIGLLDREDWRPTFFHRGSHAVYHLVSLPWSGCEARMMMLRAGVLLLG